MNRRAFLGTLGVFSILPGAGRVWRAVQPAPKLIPFWYQTQMYCRIEDVGYQCVVDSFLKTHKLKAEVVTVEVDGDDYLVAKYGSPELRKMYFS